MSKVLETLLNRGKKRQGAASKAGKGTAGRSAARYGAVLALMVGVALMQPAAYAADPATQDDIAGLQAQIDQLKKAQTHYFSVNDGGTQGSNYNNDGAKSVNSIAIGKSAIASKANGIALGNGASINYDEAVAIGRGTRAGGVGSIALGGGAMIASNGYDMTSIAIGRQAYVLNGSGGQEYMLSFD